MLTWPRPRRDGAGMITRYALFEGTLRNGQADAFRQAVLEEVVPKWRALPGALAVRVTFSDSRDAGAPEFPLILAIDYPDLDALAAAVASAEREACREALEGQILPRFFAGRPHHHVTQAHAFATG